MARAAHRAERAAGPSFRLVPIHRHERAAAFIGQESRDAFGPRHMDCGFFHVQKTTREVRARQTYSPAGRPAPSKETMPKAEPPGLAPAAKGSRPMRSGKARRL